MQLIGRERETKELTRLKESSQAEFVVLYGRRRVGKTFLVRSFFDDKFSFYCTGLAKGTRKQQLANFGKMLSEYSGQVSQPKDWFEAFDMMKAVIARSRQRRKVVFLDEVPWMDTQKSEFKQALDLFWNGWGMMQDNLMFIICGSAASWMVKHVINDKGGLHNRVTCQIALEPFNLAECKEFAIAKRLPYSDLDLAEAYMIFGGIPFYWNFLQADESLAQSVDRLFFAPTGPLRFEFSELFASLFNEKEAYLRIISALATKKRGLSQAELCHATRKTSNGEMSKCLLELEQCGFIRRYAGWGKKTRDSIYQLIDSFVLFHYAFLDKAANPDPQFWEKAAATPTVLAWKGMAFERLALQHIPQIKKALGIFGVLTKVYAWRHQPDDVYPQGAQIDLIIERADRVVNLCEMKWSENVYVIDKEEDLKLHARQGVFRAVTKTRLGIHLTMVTTNGVAHNKYWGTIQSEVDLKDLFVE